MWLRESSVHRSACGIKLRALNSQLTILSLQIGIVDVLREEYGIEPAGMLGHSAGEIPCGYADGCLTREQTILIAYHRGTPRYQFTLLYLKDARWLNSTTAPAPWWARAAEDCGPGLCS